MLMIASSIAAFVVAPTPGHANAARIPQPTPVIEAPATLEAEAFVWPKNVAELLEMDPKYLERWLVSRNCPEALIADYQQDLLVHLLTPNKACRELGCSDRLGLYDPALLGGATTKRAWAYWLSSYLLTNQYSKIINAYKRGGTSGPAVISITEDEGDLEKSKPTWQTLLTPGEYSQFVASVSDVFDPVTSQIRMDEILRTAQEEIGDDAVALLEALRVTDTMSEAAVLLSMPADKVRRDVRTLRSVLESVLGVAPSQSAAA